MNRVGILHAVYRAERGVPFDWRGADCLAFCGSCAKALTGTDPTEALRRQYHSEIGAKRVMLQRGWSSLGDVAAHFFPEIAVARAQSGDWALVVNEDGRETLGVVVGSMIAARALPGLGQVPLLSAQTAYRVA